MNFAIIIHLLSLYTVDASNIFLRLVSSSPAVLNSQIKFNALFSSNETLENKNLTVKFWDNIPDGMERIMAVTNDRLSFLYSYNEEKFCEGDYVMSAKVYKNKTTLARANCSFSLTKYLNGKLNIYQGNFKVNKDMIVSTNDPTNVSVALYDPQNFLTNSTLRYNFSLNNKVVSMNSVSACSLFNVTYVGQNNISVSVIAQFSGTNMQKFGFFRASLRSIQPIEQITILGTTILSKGDILELKIDCDGTGGWIYCWSIESHEFNFTGHENCLNPSAIIDGKCSFSIQWYFSNPGKRKIFFIIANKISTAYKIIDVNIIHRDLVEPKWYFAVMPILSLILCLISSVAALVIWKKGKCLDLNSSFDPPRSSEEKEEENDLLQYMSFTGRLRHSIMTLIIRHSSTASGGGADYSDNGSWFDSAPRFGTMGQNGRDDVDISYANIKS